MPKRETFNSSDPALRSSLPLSRRRQNPRRSSPSHSKPYPSSTNTMDHTPPPPCTTSIPAANSAGSSPSSAMLGLSSSAHSHRRRFSPSLYPSPAPPLPGRVASGPGSGYSSGLSSRFQFQHIPPPFPMAEGARRSQIKRGLPTPFLSELSAIRRMGASLFGDLETRATAAVQRNATRSAALLGRQQLQPSPSAFRVAGTPTLLPSGSFSELAPPVPRQPSSSIGIPPLPCPSFSGSWNPPASHQQQAQPSSTDLTAPVHGRSFSGFAPPVPRQQQQQAPTSFTNLAHVPSESLSSGLVPRHSETTSASSSWSAPPGSDTIYLHAQPLLSDSQLQPLPQSLQMQSDDRMPFCQQPSGSGNDLAPLPSGFTFTPRQLETTTFGSSSWPAQVDDGSDILYGNAQPLIPSLQMQSDGIMMPFWQPSSGGGNNGTSGFVQPASGSESFEFGHDDGMPITIQQHTPPLFQMKEEPIDAPAPWVQPEMISLDDDDDDGLSSLLHSFKSSSEPASLTTLEPTSSQSQDRLHIGGSGSGSGPSAWATVVEGSCQSWEAMLLTPATNTGGNNTCGTSGIPWNCHMSMSQQQAPHMGEQFSFSPASSDIAAQSNTSESLFGQFQPNLQMPLHHPSSADRLQLNSSRGPSVWSTANSSGQGCSAMPEALLASKFGQMSIDGGWQATTPPAATNFDMFGVSGSSGTSAGATLPWNYSSSSMDETPSRLAPRQPSLHGAGARMLRSGAHGDFFSEDEMRTINKEKRLKELVNADPKRVKRILSNRASAAQLKARKTSYTLDLQHRAEALNMEYLSLSTQVRSHQEASSSRISLKNQLLEKGLSSNRVGKKERYVDLKTQNSEMQVKLQVLNEQASLKEALNGQLTSEIRPLKLLDELNMLRANGLHNTLGSQMAGDQNAWYVDGLQQLMDSHMSDASVSYQMPTQEQPPQCQQQQ